ncbi:hypothetical protein BU24DRAFT_372899 [Aaosphaeria arxii CBS 175.79]|uniref:Uncharacterized protein n=1 Tax=Aaosphaeria arxii CBS 175.79 TaxID=1450172 RepID=A0A6A5XKX7_9PLEO|nr:uncharacterized protein BU24DRAFT_372899 [Aaosphaeria arxii CBS 175.79]KAF2013467.1 hypothetical protein BU24DRAFT_372899 [Aaosphaeria arxii CBS 175.79]
MSANSSDEIIRACRAQGFSVTSAINAAIIRATTQFPQDADANAYAIFAPIDLRGPLMALGAEECSQPTGSYVSGLPLRIEGIMEHSNNGESVPAKSFSTLARELGAFYSQDIQHYKTPGSNTDKTASLLQLASPYMEGISKIFAQHSLPGCPFPKAPVISSFGKMDALIKSEYPKNSDGPASSKLQVTDFWVSCDTATPMITFNPWSWENEMTLSAAWNESFYSTEFACDVLEKTIQELCDGLLIKKASYRKIQSCNDTQKQSL